MPPNKPDDPRRVELRARIREMAAQRHSGGPTAGNARSKMHAQLNQALAGIDDPATFAFAQEALKTRNPAATLKSAVASIASTLASDSDDEEPPN